MKRRVFKEGRRYRICINSGVDSGKIGRVIAPFPWREQEGAYKAPDLKREVALALEDGTRIYMYKDRLIPVEFE